MPDPASDVVSGDRLVDRLRPLSPLGRAHLERSMDGSRRYLDVKGIDAQPMNAQFLMGAG